jgi:type VI secretion system secreted protein VgrG
LRLVGNFPSRPYAVQRNETDFGFISRLMEEEGIFYYFTHSATGHELVIANTPQAHPTLAGPAARWTGATVKPQRIHEWTKTQELRSGKVTLADHAFQLPDQQFVFTELIQESVAAGQVTHRLRLPGSEALEVYDFPGRYAGRFDGVDGVNPATIEDEGLRAVEIRVQEEAAQALVIRGSSDLGQLTSGHKFSLAGHFNADGEYVLAAVRHSARLRKGRGAGFDYQNSFTCIPAGLPFRPARVTPRPHLGGLETAFVTGPAGSEIHTDSLGRVKVQFHWDREGQHDDKSSVWLRVSQLPTGGSFAVPEVGDEVLVAFMHGDPDRPVIVGSVWNPLDPPPPR